MRYLIIGPALLITGCVAWTADETRKHSQTTHYASGTVQEVADCFHEAWQGLNIIDVLQHPYKDGISVSPRSGTVVADVSTSKRKTVVRVSNNGWVPYQQFIESSSHCTD